MKSLSTSVDQSGWVVGDLPDKRGDSVKSLSKWTSGRGFIYLCIYLFVLFVDNIFIGHQQTLVIISIWARL